jgi:hypothetical protein
MGLMEILSNLLNLTDPSNLFKIHFERFRDKTEYKGERIKSFILFIILICCLMLFIFGISFLIYKMYMKLNS